MNATKRKFNSLLQGIGTRSSSTNPAAPTDTPRKSNLASLSADSQPSAKSSSFLSDTLLTVSSQSTPPLTGGAAASPAPAVSTASTPAGTPRRLAPSTSSPAMSAAAAELEFLAKRRRVGAASSTLRDTSGNAVPRASNSILRKWGAGTETRSHPAQPPTPAPAPRYCPGDREQLLRRLATFQELTDWTPKPDRINEIEWAKRGWACQGKERLRCTLCSRELVVRLVAENKSDKEKTDEATEKEAREEAREEARRPDTEEALVAKYADLIVSAHQEACLWARQGCDDSLLRLTLANPRQALADLRLRYDELCARRDFLPYEFNLRLPAGLDLDAVVQSLPPTFFDGPLAAAAPASLSSPSTSSSSSPPNRVALALAVLGWQGLTNSRIGPVPNSASCHACLRRLGLWMFKSKQVDLETNTVLEPAPMDSLDAVREHRFFCPWKNGAVQRNPGGRSGGGPRGRTSLDEPGWAVLVQVLRNDAYLRNRDNNASKSAHGRHHSSVTAEVAVPATPMTPRQRPVTAGGAAVTGDSNVLDDSAAPVDDEATSAAKDKERWARLRRVKSLFDPARKLKRSGTSTSSRPGTAQSIRTDESSIGR